MQYAEATLSLPTAETQELRPYSVASQLPDVGVVK